MVDQVVIINRGRFVTQGPIDEIVAHMGRAVVVRSPDADRFARHLSEEEATVTRSDDGRLLVSRLSIEEVGRLAAKEGVILYGLQEQGLSL